MPFNYARGPPSAGVGLVAPELPAGFLTPRLRKGKLKQARQGGATPPLCTERPEPSARSPGPPPGELSPPAQAASRALTASAAADFRVSCPRTAAATAQVPPLTPCARSSLGRLVRGGAVRYTPGYDWLAALSLRDCSLPAPRPQGCAKPQVCAAAPRDPWSARTSQPSARPDPGDAPREFAAACSRPRAHAREGPVGPRPELQKLKGNLSTRRLSGSAAGMLTSGPAPQVGVLVVLFPTPTHRSILCGPLDLAILFLCNYILCNPDTLTFLTAPSSHHSLRAHPGGGSAGPDPEDEGLARPDLY